MGLGVSYERGAPAHTVSSVKRAEIRDSGVPGLGVFEGNGSVAVQPEPSTVTSEPCTLHPAPCTLNCWGAPGLGVLEGNGSVAVQPEYLRRVDQRNGRALTG